MDDIMEAISAFKSRFPGWWFTVGECSVSCDATVGPDVAYCCNEMCDMYDDGFSLDLCQPSSISNALTAVSDIAAKKVLSDGWRNEGGKFKK